MYSEGFVDDRDQINVTEPWPDEPSKEAGLAWPQSGSEPVCGTGRLTKLPTSRFRSLGGYLNYAGWPNRQRFIELDRAIRLRAHESQNTEGGADSNDCPAESYRENLGYIDRLREESCLPADGHGHWNGICLADLLTGLEDLPIRRL